MAVLTFIKQHISTANATVYTFSSTSTGGANDIGATASDRQVIIAGFIAATTTATRSIDSVTPGGVAAATATQLNFFVTSGVSTRSSAHTLVNALVATATSISIVLTATTTVARAAIAVWSATHVGATFATYGTWATDSDGYISNVTSTDAGMNVTVNTSGFFVAHAGANSSAATPSYVWTDATEQHDTSFGEANTSHSGADGTNTATVNCQISVSVTNGWWTGIWGAFDDASPGATGAEELYRKFTAFPGTLVGRRKLITFPRPVYEWRPEARP